VFRVSLQRPSEIVFILRRSEKDMIENVYWSSCKVICIPVRFSLNFLFPNGFLRNIKISNITKIRPVGTEFFLADRGRIDMMKLIFAFVNLGTRL
jgi:hypothetical protein